MSGARLDAGTIRAAWPAVPPEFRSAPQFVSETLSDRAGRPVVVKVETVNPIGAFKGRGAWLAVAGLRDEGRVGQGRGVVVASTGNFGQAVAYAGRGLGVPVTVFADEGAHPRKLARIRRFGAEVRQVGHDFDAAREASEAYAVDAGLELLVDGQDARVAVGAGTMALEVTDAITQEELPRVTDAYVPVGNGALIAGVATWLHAALAAVRVVGVQSDAAPSMTLSWRAGRPIATEHADTRAGGIATRVPVPEALAMMAGVVDEMLLVPEASLEAARHELTEALGVTVELSAAAGWAAVLADKAESGAALLIVTGSNAEPVAR